MKRHWISIVFLLFFAGFAFAFSYEKPVASFGDFGFKIRGESNQINCSINYCWYDFEIENFLAINSNIQITPYFSGKILTDYKLERLDEITVFETKRICDKWIEPLRKPEDKNVEKQLLVCDSWTDIEVPSLIGSWVSLPSTIISSKDFFGSKEFTATKKLTDTLLSSETKRFRITFRPIDKEGQLVLIVKDSVKPTQFKASLDPWWNTNWLNKRVLSVCAGVRRIDANYLTPVSLPVASLGTDMNDVRFVFRENNDYNEFNYYNVDYNTVQDINLLADIRLPYPLLPNTCSPTTDSNGALFVYYNNPSQTTRVTARSAWDLNYEMYDKPTTATPIWSTEFGNDAGLDLLSNIERSGQIYTDATVWYGTPAAALPAKSFSIYKVRLKMITCPGLDDKSEVFVTNGSQFTQVWLGNECNYVRVNEGTTTGDKNIDLTDGFHWFWITISDTDTNLFVDMNFFNPATGDVDGAASPDRWYLGVTQVGIWDYFKETRSNTLYVPLFAKLGIEEAIIDINFSYKLTPGGFDLDGGVTTISGDFNNFSNYTGTITDGNWYFNPSGILPGSNTAYKHFTIANDENLTRPLLYAGGFDYNVCLRIQTDTPATSQYCRTITILEAPKNIQINWIYGSDTNFAFDINFSYTTDSNTALATQTWSRYHWGDLNQQDTNKILHSYWGSDGNTQVCVNIMIADVNRSKCSVYFATMITVRKPKDEADLNVLIPYEIYATSNKGFDINLIVNDKNTFLFGFSTSQYTIKSHYGSYYPRTYTLDEDFADTNRFLEPYLVSTGGGIESLIIAYDKATKRTLSSVLFSIKRLIGGSLVEVLSLRTDDKGEATGAFTIGNTYYFDVNYGVYYKRFEIRPFSNSYTINFFLDQNGGVDFNISPFAKVDVNVIVNGSEYSGVLSKSIDGTFDFNIGINPTNLSIIFTRIMVWQDGNLMANVVDDVAPYQQNFKIYSSSTRPIEVEITTFTTRGIFITKRILTPSGGGFDRLAVIKNIILDIGSVGGMILAFITTFFVVAFFHYQKVTDNYDVLGLVVLVMWGLFAYLGWLHWAFLLLGIIVYVVLNLRRLV